MQDLCTQWGVPSARDSQEILGPLPRTDGLPGCMPAIVPPGGVATLGSDTGNDVNPPPYAKVPSPIHRVGITAMGLWILDDTNLEEAAEACRQRNRWEFLVDIGPLRLHHATKSPVKPIAVS